MAKDPEFRTLCDDHEACANALHYWAKSKETEAEARIVEYHNLIQDLEDEIGEALESCKSLRLK